MSVSLNSQVGSSEQMNAQLLNTIFSMLRVSLPGIIESYDPIANTCTVQPALKGHKTDQLGNLTSAPLPLLVDVPIIFPRGGGCTITFPVKAGDECLVVFSDRCIDFWWQSGGVQEPVDPRQHDLSDAFAIVGPQSQPNVISNISTTTLQMRTDDGFAYIELDPNSHGVNIMAPGGFNVKAPLSEFSNAVKVNGLLTWLGGMVGSTVSGVAAKISGAIQFIGTLTSNGKDISDQHTHDRVQTGNDKSGKVS